MNASMLFVLIALGIALCVAVVFLWVLMRERKPVTQASQAKANAKVYRDQISDLDREHDSGYISDQEWQQSRDEMSLRLLEDTSAVDDPAAKTEKPAIWTAVVLAVALPLGSMGLYMWVGQPEALNPLALKTPDQVDPKDLAKMAQTLAEKLKDKPDNLQGWVMLGRTYRTLENFDAALKAYDSALKLSADDDLKLERIEIIAMQRQGQFEGEPWNVIREILQRDSQHFGALLTAGSASFAEGKFADALKFWEQARKPLDANNPDLEGLESAIAAVRERLGMPPTKATPAATSGLNVTGQVNLSASLKSKASPNDVVFIYATPANGDRMPLAIFKTTVSQLPFNFTLDDSTAMAPDRKLSAAGEVMVKVRVTKSGNAMPQSGDLSGSLGPVKVGAKGLKLEIKDQIP
ncbi:MAG: c-type cytochrome biogenesis protein CcmI [Limnohabitans sp.]|nr:c-type cytochrome biogenesis protein CcmI [Limnohabitans sp.]